MQWRSQHKNSPRAELYYKILSTKSSMGQSPILYGHLASGRCPAVARGLREAPRDCRRSARPAGGVEAGCRRARREVPRRPVGAGGGWLQSETRTNGAGLRTGGAVAQMNRPRATLSAALG